MKASASNGEGIVPAVHLEFIQNHLENPDGSPADEIEQYHRNLFLHHHAVEWEKHRQVAKTHEEKLTFLQEQLKKVDAGIAQRNRLVPVMVNGEDRKSTRLNSSHLGISYAVFCFKKKKNR